MTQPHKSDRSPNNEWEIALFLIIFIIFASWNFEVHYLGKEEKERDLVEFMKFVAMMIGGTLAFFGYRTAEKRADAMQVTADSQARATASAHWDIERKTFQLGVEMVDDSKNLSRLLAGVLILEKLMQSSPVDYGRPVCELLSSVARSESGFIRLLLSKEHNADVDREAKRHSEIVAKCVAAIGNRPDIVELDRNFDLSELALHEANLSNCRKLGGLNFEGLWLFSSTVSDCTFEQASLERAVISGETIIQNSNLKNCDFSSMLLGTRSKDDEAFLEGSTNESTVDPRHKSWWNNEDDNKPCSHRDPRRRAHLMNVNMSPSSSTASPRTLQVFDVTCDSLTLWPDGQSCRDTRYRSEGMRLIKDAATRTRKT